MEYSNADYLKQIEKNKQRTKNKLIIDTDIIKDLKELEKTDRYRYANKEKKKQMQEAINNKTLNRWF